MELRLLSEKGYSAQFDLVENELVEEYLDDSLLDAERMQFERYFLKAPQRREKLSFATNLRQEAHTRVLVTKHQTRWYSFSHVYLKAAMAVLVLVCVVVAAWLLLLRRKSNEELGMADLRAAYKNQRLVEARITSLDYAPLAVMRGEERPNVDEAALRRAELQLLKDIDEHPDAKAFHALGRFYLAGRQFDKAIEQFEKALRTEPNNARLENDLGAALLERGKEEQLRGDAGKSMESFARSLDHLNRALALDATLLDALFNRAVLHQTMALPKEAEEDWKKYLERDSSSPWAEEARKNLKLLEEQKKRLTQNKSELLQEFDAAYREKNAERAWRVFNLSRARTGNVVIEALIDDYLALSAKGLGESDDKLSMILFAGETEEGKAGDRFTIEMAQFYRSASPQQRKLLIQARSLMRSANQSYNNSELEAAIEDYSAARRLFERAGDYCEALFADSWTGYCYLRIPDTKQSIATFERLSVLSKERGYKSLLAQSQHALADANTSLDELSKALGYAGHSLKISEEIQDTTNVLRCLQLFVSVNLKLGNYYESLNSGWRAFNLLQSFPADPKLVWPFYHEVALDLYLLGLPTCALEFQKEALQLAEEAQWPLIKSRSYARLGLIYEKLQNYGEAIRNGKLALEEGKNIAGEASRSNIIAYSSLRLGDLCRQTGDFNGSLENYDQAIGLYQKLGLNIYLYEAHKGKLLAFIALGNDASAREELGTALSLFEQYRQKILEERNRDSFFDVGQSIYDIATDFAYSRMNSPQLAFNYTESARARSLLDLIHENPRVVGADADIDLKHDLTTKPLALSELQRRIPDQAQIVQYSVLENKLIIWLVSKTRFETKAQQLDAGELNRMVLEYSQLIRKNDEDSNDQASVLAKKLYAILIDPIQPLLDSKLQLCVVPDKILNFLPFNALISPSTGRYVIEDYRLLLSPSSNIFLTCTETAHKKGGIRSELLLSVGNPTYDRDKFPDLPDLPGARREAEAVADYYNARPLIGDRARESLVREEMRKVDVIHFASHYVINDTSPLLSELLLAKEPPENSSVRDTDGALQSIEIYQVKLPRVRLVVLSACQTGIERSYRGEGAISIARPFISAGVPIVVASLWPVDSDPTAELMISFHRHRKQEGLSTVEALRRAQLDMLSSQNKGSARPFVWAAFAPIGGYAEF